MGFRPSSSAFSALIISTAAAPSLIPQEFPAVTEPPSRKTGRIPDSRSIEVSSWYLPSSSR